MLQLGHQGQVGRQVRADVFAQLSDGLAHRQGATVLLAGQEQELRAVGLHHIEKDPHRRIDNAAHDEFVVTHQADGFAEGLADFADQGQAQLVHVVEVPVEPGGHDAGCPGDFPQAQAAESAAALHQMAGCVHQGNSGLLFLFGAGQHRKADF
ncbi:hypothetical protein SRABI06_05117 [Pseudomonas brassicacearum]|nr:hypothetical protein SRABI06_05117 [Pseudomonas brassicacearum]